MFFFSYKILYDYESWVHFFNFNFFKLFVSPHVFFFSKNKSIYPLFIPFRSFSLHRQTHERSVLIYPHCVYQAETIEFMNNLVGNLWLWKRKKNWPESSIMVSYTTTRSGFSNACKQESSNNLEDFVDFLRGFLIFHFITILRIYVWFIQEQIFV